MLKRDITYEDFDGESVTESFYFNLTKTELIELEVGYKDGLEAAMQRIVKTEDRQALIAEFQRIILLSYGVKSDDGRRFMKSDQLREEFTQTPAYDALFIELATDDKAAATFIQGILPKGLVENVETVNVVDVPVKE
jgi:hypothetical protein